MFLKENPDRKKTKNEIKTKHFLKKFDCSTKDHFDVAIKWKTRQVKT